MLHLAILWHQHQPFYRDLSHPTPSGSYVQPWVRLHAIRDYYSMASIAAEHPGIHVTINLTPVLLWQLDDYLDAGATDTCLELTRREPAALKADERERVLSSFFEADWHNQIFPHPRYRELFLQRREGRAFGEQDLRDLQMWFNLAWFGREFRDGEVELTTGEVVSVRRFVEQGRGFRAADVNEMIEEQFKILRAVVPIHRRLQEEGRVEISTTPFAHPILPLLVDTDRATIDRPGASYPRRFAHPKDAERQVRMAIDVYRRHFGARPRGMWPAEGAVAQFIVPFFALGGVRWIATDRGVLARSGRWGYDVENPEVLCQPYRAVEGADAVSVFFRDTKLSDSIGFRLSAYSDAGEAARDFITEIEERFLRHLPGDRDSVLTVALDGENAWGAYRDDARPFLHALYGLLERHDAIRTVTFSEYLNGDFGRDVAPHPAWEQTKVFDLFTGSWIDESGSGPGLDLGTWIGEEEENRAWALLGETRDFLSRSDAMPETSPTAFLSLYLAQGSDWFWWLGDDQDSGRDDEFDDLFRLHLKNVYRALKADPPEELDRHIVPHLALWTFSQPIERVQRTDRLTVRTNCPGVLSWRVNDGASQSASLSAVGGVMAGTHRYQLTLGPFPEGSRNVRFSFHCTHPGCDGTDICCKVEERTVSIIEPAAGGEAPEA
jgi:alpha-amylase/alpha-mannosidase (GH57 family)